jgi:uncharacterized protein (UPF0333 family)
LTSPKHRPNTAEYVTPLYPGAGARSGPSAVDAGPSARPRPAWPDDDPLGDTDAHGRRASGDGRSVTLPGRSRRGGQGAPQPAVPAWPERMEQWTARAAPYPIAPQATAPSPVAPHPIAPHVTGPHPIAPGRRDGTGPQRRIDVGHTGPQRRTDGLTRPDPLTDSGIGVLWATDLDLGAPEPSAAAPAAATAVAPETAIADAPPGQPSRRRAKARKPAGRTQKTKPAKQKPAKSRPRRGRRAVALLLGALVLAAVAAVGYYKIWPVKTHTVTTPAALGSYTRQQANATARALKHRIVTAAGGNVKNVVAAVYRQKGAKGPQIVVFIGGNLTGNASASDLISAYMARLHKAFTTNPGSLGGQAVCAPGANGGPAECAWADRDTFGVVVSATLHAPGLADEMRQMRSLVEHVIR